MKVAISVDNGENAEGIVYSITPSDKPEYIVIYNREGKENKFTIVNYKSVLTVKFIEKVISSTRMLTMQGNLNSYSILT